MRNAVLAAVFLLAVAVHLSSLGFGFTGWDDTGYVLHNPDVTEARGFWRVFTSAESDVYYPLTYASYWLEYRLWGAHPAGYHATNVLLHGVNAALVVLLVATLGGALRDAALAGALFAVHPLQVMTVAWIAERKNLLAVLFVLLALLAWLRGRRLWALGAFVAALAAKTVVLGLPLGLLLHERLVRRRSARESLRWAAPMLLAGVAAALTTIAFERPFVDRGASNLTPGLLERVQIAGAAPWFYLAKVLLPVGLSPAYPRWEVDAGKLLWWLPLLATLAVALAFARVLPALRSGTARTAAWLVVLAALLLGPSLGIVAFANLAITSVSDHFLYVPSPALFGAIALGVREVPRIAKVAAVLICAALSLAYAPVFRDAESLWSRVVAADPDGYAGNLGLAEAWSEKGRFADALPLYERALAAEPLAADAYLLLGKRKSEHGDDAGAAALFARASELSPGSAPARLGLAAAQERLGSVDDALLNFERAARLAPRDPSARVELGRMYLAFARPADALPEFQAVLDASPGHPRAALGAATSLRSLARHGEAVTVLKAALARTPDDVSLLNLLALTLATSRDDRVRNGSEAVRLAERAVARSGDPELRATLAAAYAEAGRYDEALAASAHAEAEASAAGNARAAAECRRRAELYARGEPLRL